MEHTKGEWEATSTGMVVIENKAEFIPSPQHPIFVVAQCGIYNNVLTHTEKMANAHLIAAAPIGDELATAVLNMNPEDFDDYLEIKKLAQEFKAKAEGRS